MFLLFFHSFFYEFSRISWKFQDISRTDGNFLEFRIYLLRISKKFQEMSWNFQDMSWIFFCKFPPQTKKRKVKMTPKICEKNVLGDIFMSKTHVFFENMIIRGSIYESFPQMGFGLRSHTRSTFSKKALKKEKYNKQRFI